MGSKIFNTLLVRAIERFISTYKNDSNSIFKDINNKLIHPGEYGTYRERRLKELISLILPKTYNVSSGFIITANDHVSTQCDLLIYNSSCIPLTDDGITCFYQIEEVRGVVEVKSNLSKVEFKDALLKLAKIKQLGKERLSPQLENKFTEHDNIPTFLLCNKLSFDVNDICFEDIYGDIDRRYWHNSILSLEDCCFCYRLDFSIFDDEYKDFLRKKGADVDNCKYDYGYSQFIRTIHDNRYVEKCNGVIITNNPNDVMFHIKYFLNIMKDVIEESQIYKFSMMEYLDLQGPQLFGLQE